MAQEFAYLVAVPDLYSRKVLSFRVSNTVTAFRHIQREQAEFHCILRLRCLARHLAA